MRRKSEVPQDPAAILGRDGCVRFAATQPARSWAVAAGTLARSLSNQPEHRLRNLRHGKTWFVGVDLLPNDANGAIADIPLRGPWQAHLPVHRPLHRAQVSIVYPGYPRQDPEESEANHRYRVRRRAAHMDGLLPEGPERRRYPREFHAYVLGVHLDGCSQAPTVYWRGSHRIMGQAMRAAIAGRDSAQVDVTEAYHAARRHVFETCEMVPLDGATVGASFLMHRFTLHGTEPWEAATQEGESRMIAFLRPEFETAAEWLTAD